MEAKNNQEGNVNNLHKCPFCPCCFCNEADLKKHLSSYGTSKDEHFEEFRKAHGRLEHGSFGGPE
ncbi:hypothetical protein MUP42_00895 [Candidatus Bathyarchaeota archaeon]|nr:hypothetical protein [Candidatus Bathyarchaeota archaeon]